MPRIACKRNSFFAWSHNDMPILYARLLAALLVGALLAGGGYRLGRDLERGRWTEREAERLATDLESQRARSAAATRISAATQQAQARSVARVRTVIREIPVPARPDCEWSDPERLRLGAIYDAHFADPAGGVPDPVRAPAAPDRQPAAVGD